MSQFLEKVKVLLNAVPAWGATATAVLTFLATYVVPKLPGDWPVKAGAFVAAALGFVATVVSVVSRVTPAPADQVGLLPAEPKADGEFWGEAV